MSLFRLNPCPYPVGDICIRTTNVNPSTTWPGTTWTEIAQGRVLVGADSSHAAKATGDPTHTHGMQGHTHDHWHTHGMRSHTHSWGLSYAAFWRTVVVSYNADEDKALIQLTGQTSVTQEKSQWNHQANNGVESSQKSVAKPNIVTKTANTGGPSNNTTDGPSGNTSGGPSNDTTTASSCMPPWYGVHYWLRTA